MRYIKVGWQHEIAAQPVLIMSELDDSGWELRKIELFRDGRMTRTDDDNWLSEVPTPNLAAINQNPVLSGEEITGEQFEEVWLKAEPRPESRST